MTERQFVHHLNKRVNAQPLSQRQLSASLGFAPQYLNKVLNRDIRPTVYLARMFGFRRVKLAPKRYVFIEEGEE